MRKKLYVSLIATVLCFLLIPLATFAWFYVNDRTPMRFEMLEIRSKVTLYSGNDINFNGVPDLAVTPEQMTYYTERYDFRYLSEDHAITEASSAEVQLKITVTDLMPGETRTFKLALENTGDTDNAIRLRFDIGNLSDAEKQFLSLVSVRASKVVKSDDGDNYTLERGEKYWFLDAMESGTLDGVFSDSLPGLITSEIQKNPEAIYRDFWLQFYMEPLDSLNAHIRELNGNGGNFTEFTETAYNALAGQSAGLGEQKILFYVSFDVDLDTK